MTKEENKLGYFRVICVPMAGSAAEKRGTKRVSVQAYNSRNAAAIAYQKLDLHPKNWTCSTDRLTGDSENGHIESAIEILESSLKSEV